MTGMCPIMTGSDPGSHYMSHDPAACLTDFCFICDMIYDRILLHVVYKLYALCNMISFSYGCVQLCMNHNIMQNNIILVDCKKFAQI